MSLRSWARQRENKAGPGCGGVGWALGGHRECLEEWEWQMGADTASARFPPRCCQISPHPGLSKLWRMACGAALADEP